ncbi:MAG: divergent PAP2 family protein [candidate division WOR-3 bacterium]
MDYNRLLRLFFLPYLSGLICQGVKIFNHWIMGKKFDINLKSFLELGGMPSAHSASTITLSTLIAIYYGVNSPLFIISFFLSSFIIGEAYVVRGVIGKHRELINKLIEISLKEELGREATHRIGHTPLEVIMGVILGFFFAFAFAGI